MADDSTKALNMSLDQLIAQARTKKPVTRSSARGGRGATGGRGRGATGASGGRSGPARAPLKTSGAARLNGPQKVTVNLNVRRGGISKPPVISRARNSGPPRAPLSGPPPPGRWQHDLYNPSEQRTAPTAPALPSKMPTSKLFVSNLAVNVTDDDIKELFGVIGPLKECFIHFDKSGRSLGTASVVYERPNDAVAAVKKYNRVQLDGVRMQIELVEAPPPPPGTVAVLSSGLAVIRDDTRPAYEQRPSNGAGGRGARGGGNFLGRRGGGNFYGGRGRRGDDDMMVE